LSQKTTRQTRDHRGKETEMTRYLGRFAAAWFVIALSAAPAALAQKQGGVLRQYMIDSPASMSIHEEATIYAQRPMMAVFNNLVLFDQHVKQNTLDSIVPDLATGWSWSEDGTELTFPLRQGVKWHDGKPFTATDVKYLDPLTGNSGEVAHQPAQTYGNPRRGHHQWRLRGYLSSEAATAEFPRAARLGVLSGLSLPYTGARHAQSPDRHRAVQICRVQAQ
jgi:hypothetical protein